MVGAIVILSSQGIFNASRWEVFVNESAKDVWTQLGYGVLATLQAAGIAAVIAFPSESHCVCSVSR
ncbi:hypothetical protein StoSoilB13_15270 [Arthrobacter sp. StoSoilB13]|nr:hypothetical protein StoSoilB13_15270 [Arthrobacter sp. StoSoilB13]